MKKFLFAFFVLLMTSGVVAQDNKAADTLTQNGLPVLKSYVAPDVVYRAKKKFGKLLYCIEKSTAANCENSYLVGLIRNGRLSMEWMCDDPKMVLLPSPIDAVAQKNYARR